MSLFAIPFPIQNLSVKAEMQLFTWNIDRDQKIYEYFGLTLPTEESGRGSWKKLASSTGSKQKSKPKLRSLSYSATSVLINYVVMNNVSEHQKLTEHIDYYNSLWHVFVL